MSATTFPCPHCAATYPLKPVLIGKVVRCTTCKQPFQLGPDGVAVKVATATPAPAPSPAASPTPPPPAVVAGGAPGRVPTPAGGPKRNTERIILSGQQKEQRKAMAASLSTAMGDALRAEAAAEAESVAQPGKPATEKRTRSARMSAAETGKRKPGPAVLTGEGEREAANLRVWIGGALAVVAMVVLLGWLLTYDGPRRQALEAFLAVVPAADNTYGRRIEAIQARAWLTADAPGGSGVAPFIDLPRASLTRVQTAPGTALLDAADKIKELSWLSPPGVWINLPGEGRKLAASVPARDAFLREAAKAKLIVLDANGLRRHLTSNGRDELTARVAVALVQGETAPGTNAWLARVTQKPPDRIESCEFSGDHGLLLVDTGSGYQTHERPYKGILVRLVGEGWPGEWRVLTLEVAAP
ncbi:MAG: hypothetical protein L6R48_11360 [Planctomycetes bacterium]|nr:hypothetical protein [Planctomycetota bacterium]